MRNFHLRKKQNNWTKEFPRQLQINSLFSFQFQKISFPNHLTFLFQTGVFS